MIRTSGLTKRYGRFAAVEGLNLHVRRGEVYGLLGPNGAGKTTTLMMMLGIIRPTSGAVLLFGEPAHRGRLDLRRRIGVAPEKHPRSAWSWMTAREYLELFADLFEVPDAWRRIEQLTDRTGLASSRGKRLRELSHGMLQKLSIVRALLPNPDLLVLDEPISGLDPLAIKQVRDLIQSENREGRSILISSHQLSEMERICNRVAILSRGRLMVEDSMTSLLGRMSSGREIRIELDSVPDTLLAELRALPFVEDAAAEGTTVVARISKEGDYRRQLSGHLYSQGLIPLSITERTPTLEDAFITITQENVGQLAGESA